jgi:hypothetical protein
MIIFYYQILEKPKNDKYLVRKLVYNEEKLVYNEIYGLSEKNLNKLLKNLETNLYEKYDKESFDNIIIPDYKTIENNLDNDLKNNLINNGFSYP